MTEHEIILNKMKTDVIELSVFSEIIRKSLIGKKVDLLLEPDGWYKQLDKWRDEGLLMYVYGTIDDGIAIGNVAWQRENGNITLTLRDDIIELLNERYGSLRNSFSHS